MMIRLVVISLICTVTMALSGDESACRDICTCKTKEGYVTCKDINSIPAFINASSVVSLTVSPNTLTSIATDDFSSFTSLAHLDLSQGNISSIEAGAFQSVLKTVTFLNMNNNKLTSIPSNIFKDSSSLVHLDISCNSLTNLQENFIVGFTNLVFLDLSGNNLSHIDNGALTNSSVETLHLSDNDLGWASFLVLRNMKFLKHLFVESNNITSLENITDHVDSALETLSLSGNHFHRAQIFPEVSSVLVSLNLSYCNISDAMYSKSFFKKVPTLETLDMSGNPIHTLFFKEVHGLANLTRLYLTSMPLLSKVDSGAFELSNLVMLDLSRNPNLTTIHLLAFKLSPKLKTVLLNDNALATIDEFMLPWNKMETVRFEGNRFVCGCSLLWVVDPTEFTDVTRWRTLFSSVNCMSPTHLAGHRLVLQTAVSLDCEFKTKANDNKSRIKTGLIAATVTVVVVSVLILVLKFRKRIMSTVRRQFRYRLYKNDLVYTVEQDTTVGEFEETTDEDHPLRQSRLDTVPL